MDNLTISACPLPFLSQTNFSATGGYIAGRFCSDDCCLPCPLQDLVFSDEFPRRIRIAGWLSIVSLVCSSFLLLTFAVLPPHKSHRHYLSIGLTVCNVIMQLAFIVPLGANPQTCHDEITPNDMYSSTACAFSGALILWGGMGSVAWVLARSLWTHLRVCWDVSHSTSFTILSHVLGWGLPTLFLGICFKFTGVSYRLTNMCFPNDRYSFTTFFAWVIAFSGLAFALQLATSGYCLWIYLLNVWKANSPAASRATGTSSDTTNQAQRTPNSRKQWTMSRQQAWARVRKVLILQWRSVTLSMLVIAITATLAAVFVSLNTSLARDKARGFHAQGIAAWGTCLIITRDKNKCLPLAAQLDVTETPLTAALIITSLIGVFSFLLLFRLSALKGWYELLLHGRERRNSGEENFLMMTTPRRITLGQSLASEAKVEDHKHSPVESPISGYFPGRSASSATDGTEIRKSYLSGEERGSLEQRSSMAEARESRFLEMPEEFERVELDRKGSEGHTGEKMEKLGDEKRTDGLLRLQ